MPINKELESDSPKVRARAARAVLAHRNVSHAQLRALADKHIKSGKHGTAKDLILLLGKLNSIESIDWLIDHVPFSVFYKVTKRIQSIQDRQPAVQALIDIGLPSLGPLLERAKTDKRKEFPMAAAAVLIGVLSGRGAIRRLTAEIAAAPNQRIKTALGKVLREAQYQAPGK
jgi:hypothetical protein